MIRDAIILTTLLAGAAALGYGVAHFRASWRIENMKELLRELRDRLRSPARPQMLCAVPSRMVAKAAGMSDGRCRHREDENIHFWWPELGLRLLIGWRFSLVIVDHDTFREATSVRPDFETAVSRPGTLVVRL